jgi:hypothetical protein
MIAAVVAILTSRREPIPACAGDASGAWPADTYRRDTARRGYQARTDWGR